MNNPDQAVSVILMSVFILVAMVGIWNNWIWVRKDGNMLTDCPGFFRFWFIITPRYLLGMKTGMEDVTL
ncbi:MAG: hypothetical protein HY457_00725 [Parcubacteria group bacterium]|nr:hypothetical protein [Parcubacteria group bacterium]